MKQIPSFLTVGCAGLVLAVACGGSSARGAAATPVLRAQIDALLKARQWPEPLPIDLPSPFLVIHDGTRSLLATTGRPAASGAPGEERKSGEGIRTSTVETTPATASEILGNTAGRLKLGGLMRLKDQLQIIVNDVPRREGDSITVLWNNSTYALRVVRLQPGLLVLRYEGAELTLSF